MSRSRFTEWFESQFGKRPCGRRTTKQLEESVFDLQIQLRDASSALRQRRAWELSLGDALCAWNAREKEPAQ